MASASETMRSWDEELARGGRLVFSDRPSRRLVLALGAVGFGTIGVALVVSDGVGIGLLALALSCLSGVVLLRRLQVIEPLVITRDEVRRQLWVGPATSFPWAAIEGAESSYHAGGMLTLLIDSELLGRPVANRHGHYWRWAQQRYARRATTKVAAAQGLKIDAGLLAAWINERVNH